MITIFKNIWSKEPFDITIESALKRIKQGNSKEQCELIRNSLDKERSNELKKNLPCVMFSGTFGANRTDNELKEHSGLIVLDFDNIELLLDKKTELSKVKYVYACWISPSGNGLKALVKIADKTKHREHFQALKEVFKEVDKSGVNISRVCYESYDPEIFINENSEVFKTILKSEKVKETVVNNDHSDIFQKILKWLSNRGDAFVKGERNLFIFKLGSACSRFGIDEQSALNLIEISILSNDNDFSKEEARRTIKSAYNATKHIFSTAYFEKEELKDKITKKELVINTEIYDLEVRPKDVIFGEDVKNEALNLYDTGYISATSTFCAEIDRHFKFKRGEITLLSGIGNYGKSTFQKYLILLQAIGNGSKFALFSPEDNPAHEFYHDLVEIYLGCDCTPSNPLRPSRAKYEFIYDLISKHIFYVYPKDVAPTPEYIKERFLELIIKEKIDGCIIDPFNQLTNDYGARSDKYLEFILSDFSRFAQLNNIYFTIIAHPTKLRKLDNGNYPCPDVFDIADGAMWNNKMDNILIYHRPLRGVDPTNPTCELHSKKIRRQKIVGVVGILEFELKPKSRRFLINGIDYMERIIEEKEFKQMTVKIEPNKDFESEQQNTAWFAPTSDNCPF